jgi:NRPS condensation-like uncharacterized protein
MKHHKDIEWTKLENASKIFPATWSMKDPKVFRLTCELHEAVQPDALQKAVDASLEDFPLYKSVLRRGIFWYYLESSDIKPVVQEESSTVCAPIYIGLRTNLLFRVIYYRKRINLEIFHALSDGAGALRFLQSIVWQYFKRISRDVFESALLPGDDASISSKMDDSFGKHFAGVSKKNRERKVPKGERAYQIRGTKYSDNRISLIEGAMSAKAVLEEAHKYNTTLTVFLSALYSYSIYKEMRTAISKSRPVVLTVPVNLRQYFESETVRNFFSYINVGYNYSTGSCELKDVIHSIGRDFQSKLTMERLDDQSNKFIALEQRLLTRVVPLPIKDFFIRKIANQSDTQSTTNVSNIGKVAMPAEFSSVIRQFSVCTSAGRTQMTMCSFGDRLVVSIASPFRETDIQRAFFRQLSRLGLDIEITATI